MFKSGLVVKDVYQGMIDSGANISMGSRSVAEALGATIHPPIDDRRIGTVDKSGFLEVVGWIYEEGYIGPISIVEDAEFLLISSVCLQANGIGIEFPLLQSVCNLYNKHGLFLVLDQCIRTKLYFVDIRCLLAKNIAPYVRMSGDVSLSPDIFIGGNGGYLKIAAAAKKSKQNVPALIIFRVWRLHKCLYHANMRTVASDNEAGRIINTDVTPKEILMVIARQDCFSCALSKWNRLPQTIPSGIRPARIRQCWSMDYIGPYAVLANGGFNGKFV